MSRRPTAPEMSLAMAVALFAGAAIGFVAVVRACSQSPELLSGAVVGIGAGAVMSAMTFALQYLIAEKRHNLLRTLLGPAVTAGFGAFVVGLVVTLPRSGRSQFHTGFGVAVITYGSIIIVAVTCAALLGSRSARRAEPISHQPTDQVEVWHVAGSGQDYFIARCECDWLGPAHDTSSEKAQADAMADARCHGDDVASEVVQFEA